MMTKPSKEIKNRHGNIFEVVLFQLSLSQNHSTQRTKFVIILHEGRKVHDVNREKKTN